MLKIPANQVVGRFGPTGSFCVFAVVLGLAVLPFSDAQNEKEAHHPAPNLPLATHGLPLTLEHYKDGFLSRTPRYTVFLEPRQLTIGLRSAADQAKTAQTSFPNSATRSFVRLRLVKSNPASIPLPEKPLAAKANYFIGNNPAKWRTNLPLFGQVRFPSVYKNVDLVYYGNQRQLEYDFVIQPGGEPQAIRFSIDGASHSEIGPNGDLILHAGDAQATLHRPLAYQILDGQRRTVDANFLSLGGSRFGIQVARYDRNALLIIDPVLAYSTFLGGSDDEGIFGIGFDDDGNIYVAGETSSVNFPHKGGVQDHVGGSYDAFVSKFNPQGTELIYSTYLGGAKYDHAVGIRVDEHGSAYVAGITQSSDFPVRNALQGTLAGTYNGFVAKLSPSGSQLEFSTYLGGQGSDGISALTIDRDHAVYVAGSTDSLDFPITSNAFQKQCDGGAHTGFCIQDAFIAKLDPAGRKLLYSTYLGGAGYDVAQGLSVNDRGEAYLAGQTGSSDFPTKNPFQSSLLGPTNAFVTELNAAGSGLVLSTFLGGNGFDGATDIALDRRGNIYVTGFASSMDFPLSHAFQAINKGFSDGFVTKFDPEASRLIYSTYYGGSGFDYPFRIAVTRHEEAVLVGITSSTDFPIYQAINPYYSGGQTDAFVALLDRDGNQPSFSTYLGGKGDDFGYAVSVGCRNSLWVAGSTSSTDFPSVRAFQPDYAGGPFDAFLSQILSYDEDHGNDASVLDNRNVRERHGCREEDK